MARADDTQSTLDGRDLIATWPWVAFVLALVALAAILRLIGARGELWLDEVWTLNQVALVSDPIQILVDLSNDNNHVLNTLYLYAVGGAQASPLLLRAGAIAFGAMSVAAAGAAAIGHGRAAAVIAMILTAIAYPLVHYGSEARGYAGLILFALVAIVCVAREVASAGDRPTRHRLGAAIGLGLLSHLAMAPAATVLGLWCIWALCRRGGRLGDAVKGTVAIFAPALAWTLAVGTFFFLGWLRHGFDVGRFPFGAGKFVAAYGQMLGLMIGIPPEVPGWVVLAGVAAAVAITTWRWRQRVDDAIGLYVGAIILLPAAMFAAQLPNTEFPRHFLFSAVVFLLFVADLLGRSWRRPGAGRFAVAALLSACVAGHAVSLARFYATGRGHYVDVLRDMAAAGPVTYASDHDFRNAMLIDFYAPKLGVTATLVPEAELCRRPPTWWLNQDAKAALPARTSIAGPGCALTFARQRVYPVWGLSAGPLELYRRVP